MLLFEIADFIITNMSLAAPEMKTLIPVAAGVVIAQTAQLYQSVVVSQPAIQVGGV